MSTCTVRTALTLTALAAALVLGACGRDERVPMPSNDTTTGSSVGSTPPSATGTTSTTAGTSPSATDGALAANSSISSNPPGAVGAAATAPLPAADEEFVTKAAQGGQFEAEIAKLAADKASDAQVKSFAQMLVDDHNSANEKLRQIASSHNLALAASLPDDKKKQLDQLSKLSGAEFDRQFVKMVGIQDHRHDIADFEKASQSAQSSDVKNFAQTALPTLKKHLAAAEKLPGAGKG